MVIPSSFLLLLSLVRCKNHRMTLSPSEGAVPLDCNDQPVCTVVGEHTPHYGQDSDDVDATKGLPC